MLLSEKDLCRWLVLALSVKEGKGNTLGRIMNDSTLADFLKA